MSDQPTHTPEERLAEYRRKRSFDRTPEPRGEQAASAVESDGPLFVIQKHAARNLHYDLRLEMHGVLKSWAVPRGPCLDPKHKQLAVLTEDHPMEYGSFEGVIPQGEYGGGTVMLWDHGTWEAVGNPDQAFAKGDLKFILHGGKLRGEWVLARMTGKDNEHGRNWLLIKKVDDESRPLDEYNILGEEPLSVATGRTMDQIAADPRHVWTHGGAQDVQRDDSHRQPTGADDAPGLFDPASLRGATASDSPDVFKPQLATASRESPDGDQWLHEIKLDGYRIIVRIETGRVRLFTRNGHDWTDRMPRIARELEKLPVSEAILDGEIVVLDSRGVSNFGALQNAFQHNSPAAMIYYAFDLPRLDGFDLSRVRLIERKSLLREVIDAAGVSEAIQYSDHIVGNGPIVFEKAAAGGTEGIICKRIDAQYEQRRSHTWLKIKALRRQEFVVAGYSDPSGSRSGFGALVLGAHDDDGTLHYCGRVGTGFSDVLLDSLAQRLQEMQRDTSPLVDAEREPDHRTIHWVEPEMVVEVEFSSWTHEGLIRHPAFVAVREDKPAAEVMLDHGPVTDEAADAARPAHNRPANVIVTQPRSPEDAHVHGVRISHPSRTVYPEARITKKQVADYYAAIADWILPHVTGRPLSIVRCPLGLAGEAFYQRERKDGFPDPVRGMKIGDDAAILIDDMEGLLSLIQMGVLEIHAWGCREDNPDKPDRLILDLDPGPGITWEHIAASGHFIRGYLDDLGLVSFAKTSGGKGLHIVIPIQRRSTWAQAKMFTLAIAKDLARMAPQNFVAIMTKEIRAGRIFIDYLRNQHGSTSVAVLSTRARPGTHVSTPIAWEELTPDLPPAQFTIRSVQKRVRDMAADDDPWAGFFDTRQSITKRMLGRFDLK